MQKRRLGLISTDMGIGRVTKVADQIVPDKNRGTFFRRIEKSQTGDCQTFLCGRI
jgi:hypothetical protein